MGTQASILVADDEESILITLGAVLEREGYAVTTAASGAAALRLLEESEFDAAVLDMRLDDMDGLDLLQQVRLTQPDCSPIMLTGYASVESAVQALRAGAYDYLLKPCELTELRHTVARAVERVSLLRAAQARAKELEQAHAAIKEAAAELEERVRQATRELDSKVDQLTTTNQQLEDTQGDLQRMVQTREEFLAAAAHDMKNPLTLIKGFNQAARRLAAQLEPPAPASLLEALEEVEGSTAQLVNLLDDFLDAARMQAGKDLSLDRTPTDLVSLARRAMQAQQRSAERHEFRFDAESVELVGCWDGRRLERVLANLLSNAVKYSPAGGLVLVRVAEEQTSAGTWALLSVQDQGVGIAAEDLTRIFDQFARGENVAGTIPGMGIGLASVRRIVEQHGGTVQVESRQGAGTLLTVRLPLVSQPSQPLPPQLPATSTAARAISVGAPA